MAVRAVPVRAVLVVVVVAALRRTPAEAGHRLDDRNRLAAAVVSRPRTPWSRMSAKVIFVGRADADMAHNSAELIDCEAATD